MNYRLAALLFCVTAAAQAHDAIYTFYVPRAASVSKVEWAEPAAGWDVTVVFESGRCQVTCTYHRMRDRFSPASLLRYFVPPATAVRIYHGPESEPETWIIDPAGTRCPCARARAPLAEDSAILPAGGLLALGEAPAAQIDPATSNSGSLQPLATARVRRVPVSLRI